jgi:hypothetical protein
MVCVIPQRRANLSDAVVQRLLEIYMGIFSPHRAIDFFPRNEFAGLIGQQNQDERRLGLQPDAGSVPSQLTAIRIERKRAKGP